MEPKLVKEVKQLAIKYPNDYELGKAVREAINKQKEKKR